jgi:hypothetical protein
MEPAFTTRSSLVDGKIPGKTRSCRASRRNPHSQMIVIAGREAKPPRGKGGRKLEAEVGMEPISVWAVPKRATHAAEARRNPEWWRAEGSIWTDRPVSALATASKAHIANAPSLLIGSSPSALPLRRRDTPDVETNDWRAACGRTARTVRRAGRGPTPSRPLSRSADHVLASGCVFRNHAAGLTVWRQAQFYQVSSGLWYQVPISLSLRAARSPVGTGSDPLPAS